MLATRYWQRGTGSEVLDGGGGGGDRQCLLPMNSVAVHGNPCHPWMVYAIGGRKSRRDVWRVPWEFLPSMDGRDFHGWQDSTDGMHHSLGA